MVQDLQELRRHVIAALAWQSSMGVDVVFGTEPFSVAVSHSKPLRVTPSKGLSQERLHSSGRDLAESCSSIDDLETCLKNFDGCGLKKTANRLCFGDGNSQAPIMLIGEAPGSQEDRIGKPFVGASGRLLDLMLSSIGLDRRQVWITNLIFWRPPGNRTPTSDEISICQPFLERQIELMSPRIILFVGGTAAKALLGVKEGVTKLRGRQTEYAYGNGKHAKSLVTFHPAFLLRQPLQKSFAWRDMLTLSSMIKSEGLGLAMDAS